MIRMSVCQGSCKHNFGLIGTYRPDEFSLIFFIIFEKTIRHPEVFTDIQIHNPGSSCSFLGAKFRRSPGSQFAPG